MILFDLNQTQYAPIVLGNNVTLTTAGATEIALVALNYDATSSFVLNGSSSVQVLGLSPSTLYALRYVLFNSVGVAYGAIAFVTTLDASRGATVLEFDADFVTVFGNTPATAGTFACNQLHRNVLIESAFEQIAHRSFRRYCPICISTQCFSGRPHCVNRNDSGILFVSGLNRCRNCCNCAND